MSTTGSPSNLPDPQGAFELQVEAFTGGDLTVVELRGREGISRLFSFEVLAVTHAPSATLIPALLGRAARVVLRVPGRGPRAFSGLIAAVAPEGAAGPDGGIAVRVRVVPRMWLLRRRTHSRIFQEQTVREIVTTVLAGLDVPCVWRLQRRQAPRQYCVQYQETDHHFVTRLLAEEGIYFFFEPSAEPSAPDDVVFGDSDAYAPIDGDPTLVARAADGMGTTPDFVSGFATRRRVRSKAVLLRDFDPQRPRYDLASRAEVPASGLDAGGSQTQASGAIAAEALRLYEHSGDYNVPEVSAEKAQGLLEQMRRRALVGRGESRCPSLAAGRRFVLTDHTLDENNGEYVVTGVEHVGRAPERRAAVAGGDHDVYRNSLECVPASVAYRPRRPTRTARQVNETALVVGPPGDEVYTDALGRIKVQFPWDLDGRHDAHSSCWMRVAQAWAGSGWGAQFIPRVGMEVLVSFLYGDTDRPVVVGCFYNPLNPPSHPLPAQATKSGFRTRTLPGPDGFNELSFEDRRGQELVFVHAQRDMHVVVREDQTTTVGRLDGLEPRGDQRTTVAGNQSVEVGGTRALRVGGDLDEKVAGSRSETVAFHAARHVVGSVDDRCEGTLSQRIGGSHVQQVDGARSAQVGGAASLRVGGDRSETIGGSSSLVVAGEVGHSSLGAYSVSSTGGVTITSGESIRLVCGDSVVELTPEGIVLSAKAISVAGAESATIAAPGAALHVEKKLAEIGAGVVKVHGKGATVVLGDDAVSAAGKKEIKLASAGASVILDSDAAIDGATVKLNCGAGFSGDFDEPDESEESFVQVALTRKAPKPGDPSALADVPVAGARFLVEASDGRVFGGVLDGEGRARVPVPKGAAKVSFPDYDAGKVKPA